MKKIYDYVEEMEHGLNEFILLVLNNASIYHYYIELIKEYGNKFTSLQYYNCLKNKFYWNFYNDKIASVLLAFNGDVTQFEKWQEWEDILQDDIDEFYKV